MCWRSLKIIGENAALLGKIALKKRYMKREIRVEKSEFGYQGEVKEALEIRKVDHTIMEKPTDKSEEDQAHFPTNRKVMRFDIRSM